jgi:5-methylcytosine-specific restriction protein A
MPGAALRECRAPHCANYAGADGLCAAHAGEIRQPHQLGPVKSRLFGRQRVDFLRRHPICAACKREPANSLDHIQPHRGNLALFWDQANWQGLCRACHGAKSMRERDN